MSKALLIFTLLALASCTVVVQKCPESSTKCNLIYGDF